MVAVDGTIKVRRERVILFDDGSRQVWLPLSQVELSEDEDSVLIPYWLAFEKGLGLIRFWTE
jgi:hypothetical protein